MERLFNILINNALMQLHTAFIGKVTMVNGRTAQVLPLTYSKDIKSNLVEQAPVTAYVPPNVKYITKDVTYLTDVSYSGTSGMNKTEETTTILIPEDIEIGDIVLCVVCERDITYAVDGKFSEPSNRKHDMNDSIIVKVL